MHISTPALIPLLLLPATHALPKIPTPPPQWSDAPKHYGILVYPGFQALDVYGPLDVLWALGPISINQTLHLSVISRTLEPVSTLPKATAMHNMSHGDFGTSVVPTVTMKEILAKQGNADGMEERKKRGMDMNMEKGDIDVLIVPGGGGTRGDVSEEVKFVRDMYPKVKYILSICTGATLLAQSGILDGRNATTNKKAWQWATSTGTEVQWIPQARWVVDGNIWTSSGVSAGIDLTLAFADFLYGQETGDYVAAALEYERWTGGPENDPFAAIWDVPGGKGEVR